MKTTKKIVFKNNRIELADEKIIFNGSAVTVRKNSQYTYKLTEKGVSALGGACGLYRFIKDCVDNDFGLIWVEAITEHLEKLTK